MTLRQKTLRILCFIFAGLIIALYAISETIVLGGFAEEETLEAHRNVERVRTTLVDDLSTLEGTTEDWAWWDDTYNFASGMDDSYIDANLTADSAFVSNRLNLMAFISTSGKVIFARAYDYRKGQELPVPQSILKGISASDALLQRDEKSSIKGLVEFPEGAMAIASKPILKSDRTGPIHGTLVFGRYLDPLEIRRLSKTNAYSLKAYRVDDPSLSNDLKVALSSVSEASPIFVQPLSEESIAGYTLLDDIYGKPVLLLKAEAAREFYAQGQRTVAYFIAAFLGVSLLFGVATMWLLEKGVLVRLSRLRRDISNIAAKGDLSSRLSIPGGDELSSLGSDLNEMLAVLELAVREQTETQQRFKAVFQNALDPMVILDDTGAIVEANPAALDWIGLIREDLVSKDSTGSNPADQVAEIEQLWQIFMRRGDKGEAKGEYDVAMPSGQTRQIEYYAKAHFIPGYHLAVVRDITERKTLEGQLAHQAFHDPLTNLPNRLLFVDRLTHAMVSARRKASSVAILFLDLDDFKVINDSLGHKAGDHLLIEVGKRLQRCVRPGDTVARLGGDEFTVLIEDVQDMIDAIEVADRIADQLQAPFTLEEREVFVTASIGIAVSSEDHLQPDDLLRSTDVAMYEAKHKGKARYVVFDQSMNTRAWERLEMEIELRRAIQRDEFRVYYQPLVQLDSGKVIGMEALVRWEHPERGIVLPSEFIPMAEETGLIIPIGQWVLETSCLQITKWQSYQEPDDPPLMLGVNLSVKQFQHPTLVDGVNRALKESGLDPSLLKLEITESVALDDTEAAISRFFDLKALGIHLAIDDFGTGYSALNYLKHYPIDILKIDKSFIAGFGTNNEDTAIVHAVVAFAKILNLRVTAEGIETAEQLAKLREIGCDWGQGYYFSKPLRSEVITALLNTGPLPRSVVDDEESDHPFITNKLSTGEIGSNTMLSGPITR